MHSHRSALKQVNKSFKGSSKARNKHGGRKSSVLASIKPKASELTQGKKQRLQMAKQQRQRKREEAIAKRRSGASRQDAVPPKFVMILPFRPEVDVNALKVALSQLSTCVVCPTKSTAVCQPITFQLPPWAQMSATGEGKKQRLTLVDVSPYLYPQPPSALFNKCDAPEGSPPPNESDDPPSSYLSKAAVHAVLDIAKAASVILCVLPSVGSVDDPPFDALGYEMMTLIKQQGLPTPVGVMVGDSEYHQATPGRKRDISRLVGRFFASEFGSEHKFFSLDSNDDLKAILRGLANAPPKEFSWRSMRGYILPDSTEVQEDPSTGTKKVLIQGYARGLGFTVKHPVHITGIGDFLLERIEALADPLRPGDDIQGNCHVIEEMTAEIEAALQEEWAALQPYNPIDGEQTWPTEEELREAQREKVKKRRIAVPEGTSEYQKAWFEGDDDESHSEDGAFEEETDGNGMEGDQGIDQEIDQEMDQEMETWDESGGCRLSTTSFPETMSDSFIPEGGNDMAAEKKRLKFELEERSGEDMQFPDEVDTPLDRPAKQRFARYRGLRSFKASPWDPNEDLPVDYSRIFEYDAFQPTINFAKRQFLQDCLEAGGLVATVTGTYVRLTLRLSECEHPKVEALAAYFQRMQSGSPPPPLLVSTLLPFERKTTVSHFQVTRSTNFHGVLPSKSTVELHCGFRRVPAKPIFSAAVMSSKRGDKAKFERFLHPGMTAVASIYAPTMCPPAPVLMLKSPDCSPEEDSAAGPTEAQCAEAVQLAATGSLLPANARRIVLKRVILTGYPFRVHKRKAVVRFMFFNPQDIRWFMPVELCTRKGLKGQIVEPLGTHGYMKCLFNGSVDHSDTVCMYLYKRVFPKWFPPSWGGLESQSVTE